MSTCLIDTNVVVRFFVGDVPSQKEQAEVWFEEARNGSRKIVISSVVIAESIYVFESFYGLSRSEMKEGMHSFLSQRWLAVEERQRLLRTLELYEEGMHVVDAFLLAGTKHGTEILTFDKKLKRKERKH